MSAPQPVLCCVPQLLIDGSLEDESFTTAPSSILSGFKWIQGESQVMKLLKGFFRSLLLQLFCSSPCVMSTGFEEILSSLHVDFLRGPGGEMRGTWMSILTKAAPFFYPPPRKAIPDLYGNVLRGKLPSERRSACVSVWNRNCSAEVCLSFAGKPQETIWMYLTMGATWLLIQVWFH